MQLAASSAPDALERQGGVGKPISQMSKLEVERPGRWVTAWIPDPISARTFSGCVPLGELLSLSVPPPSHWHNGEEPQLYLPCMFFTRMTR